MKAKIKKYSETCFENNGDTGLWEVRDYDMMDPDFHGTKLGELEYLPEYSDQYPHGVWTFKSDSIVFYMSPMQMLEIGAFMYTLPRPK